MQDISNQPEHVECCQCGAVGRPEMMEKKTCRHHPKQRHLDFLPMWFCKYKPCHSHYQMGLED